MATENFYCSFGKHKRLKKNKHYKTALPTTNFWMVYIVQSFNVHNIVDIGSEDDEVDYVL